MVDFLVVVNGIPGGGKTSLAGPLSAALGARLVAKDAIKEALSDVVGGGLPTSALGAIASENLWSLAGLLTGTVVVESYWATGRDERWVQRDLAQVGNPPGVEVWCEVALETAIERFRTRSRHAAHADLDRIGELRTITDGSRPITGLPVVTVCTDEPVDVAALVDEIRRKQ